jgi:uncharacterized protein YyaL (SSP411 family)
MDSAVAGFMNRNFISIKIDREERPDIDQIYLNAAQLISGHSGWPLNAFALPDGKPFYAGTYFPKDQWRSLLEQIHQAYTTQNDVVIAQAEALTEGIRNYELITTPVDSVKKVRENTYVEIFKGWSKDLDFANGGVKGAPKFPMPVNWEFGLQYYFLTGNKQALEIVRTTLNHMAAGGIYDQLGGGFSRYATDSAWRIPHFEKMLFDNAQLVSLYSHVYQVTKDPAYLMVVEETLEFVEREMTSEDGGFYSSINADSEGEEGTYYTWTKAEIRNILDAETAELISDYYHISDSGNWEEGKNIFYRDLKSGDFPTRHKISVDEWQSVLDDSKAKLVEVRKSRMRPSTDDKILTSWNALMIIGYLDAYVATGNEQYKTNALKNAEFLLGNMIHAGGALWRNYKDGKAGIEAFLDDYAFLAQAFIRMYQITFEMRWLETARLLADFSIAHFRDHQTGMFYYTSNLSEDLVVRKMEIPDHVMPSSNSAMAEVLFLLGEYYQDNSYSSKSQMMLNQILTDRLESSGVYYANWGRVVGLSAYLPFEVAVVGVNAVGKSLALQEHYNPLALYLGGTAETLPLLENKFVEGETIIYVCRNQVCKLPVREVSQALKQLQIN